MSNFVGRRHELASLSDLLEEVRTWRADEAGRALLLRGRRRVGKSRLVEEFCESADVPWVFFTATAGESPVREREEFIRVVAEESTLPHREDFRGLAVPTWAAFLRQLAVGLPPDQPSIVVIDELPHLVAGDAAFEGALQTAWDRYLSRRPVLLIGVGSDLSMMTMLTEYGRPFHQRATEMVLPPLSPAAVQELTQLSAADAVDAFLVTGGLPLICRQWLPGTPVVDFLHRSFADPVSALVVSGERSLAAEFPSELQARRVLSIVGGAGERTFANIARRAGGDGESMPPSTLTAALGALVDKGLVVAETPLSTKPAPRDKRYRVADPYLRFWLTFVGPSLPLLERGRADLAMRQWARHWQSWRGRTVEPVIRDAVARLLPSTQWPETLAVGGWWPRTNRPEIDLVGADREPVARAVTFVGTVKWRERAPLTGGDAAELARNALAVPGVSAQTPLVAVSRGGVEASGFAAVWRPEDLVDAWR
jgi:hypothetical protein